MYIDSNCRCVEIYEPEHAYMFTGPCSITGKQVSVTIPGSALFELRQGTKSIQSALHMLSAGEREFVITGISDEGWDKTFG